MKRTLSNSEKEMMDIFWDCGKPLSSVYILNNIDKWSETYVHVILRSLQRKKLIEVCGTEQSGPQYARQFRPTITKDEYGVMLLKENGFNPANIMKIASGLVESKEYEMDEDFLNELDSIIEKLRSKGD